MKLAADLGVILGELTLEVKLDLDDSAVVALVGPNGAGKTTLVRALAGLVPLDRGRVTINDRVIEDPSVGMRVPAEDRRLGVVFQEHRLFPNLNALENVAFGLRSTGTSKTLARAVAARWLERVGIADVAQLRPSQLSGGQAQRVALARALVVEPNVLLLDEPLAAVDAAARTELRHLLRAELRRYPGIRLVVTHDPVEAAALGDQVIVLERGRITQQGPLADVTARPRSPWVATMVGLNLFAGTAVDGAITLENGAVIATATHDRGLTFAAIRPNAVSLHRRQPEGSARNAWRGEAAELYFTGDRARVRIDGPVPLVAEVTAAAVAELYLADGGPVWASVKATDIDTYPV
ncbi:MAG: ABC transporter ATP-binding protein [Acidimicrobiia bacterium]|nr:ABC transporter ATP-binding protein [Acidimicrobiia bacterium]